MSRLVMKFGGTSVADIERVRAAAARVKAEVDRGHETAVVVSAMAGETDRLAAAVRAEGILFDTREFDTVLASGEQVAAGLMALALQRLGVAARSWLGWQIPIRTDDSHGAARIRCVEAALIEDRFRQGLHAVVAGFQGLSPANRITTLGRGGSDTTAVALASALGAERCDIYTDVDGVYTADPRVVPKARRLTQISYEEMLELASLGAKVLMSRSVALAARENVRVRVLSSFADGPGTVLCGEEAIVEERVVSGVAVSRNEAKITLRQVADRPGVAAAVFGPLSKAGVNVDMIVQNVSADGRTDVTFTVDKGDVELARNALDACRAEVEFDSMLVDDNVAKLSIVGLGMRSHAGVAQRMFATLCAEGVNIEVISTSEIKTSVLIRRGQLDQAAQALHRAFGLDGE